MSNELSRVRWQVGQALMPDHLIAQDNAVVAEMHLRQTMSGLPAFGFSTLKWNEELFVDGVIALIDACLVLKGGFLISVPHNAVCEPLNLGLFGNVKVSVYLHWMGDDTNSSDNTDWVAGTVKVPRIRHRLRLSTQLAETDAKASIQLGVFEKRPDGGWALTHDHIPPLCLVGTSPFLNAEINALKGALESFQMRLSHDSVAALSVELMYGSRECLKSLLALKRMLSHMELGIYCHPFSLFEAMISFYVEVCLYRDSTPVAARTLYDHDNLASSFRSVIGPLLEQMTVASQRTPYLEFELRDGLYSVTIPKEARAAKKAYLLVQKGAVNAEVDLKPLKLAAPARLAIVHQRALPGVGARRVDKPSLGQSFGPEIIFLELSFNDEWNAVLAESALTFYSHPSLSDCSFYLIWK